MTFEDFWNVIDLGSAPTIRKQFAKYAKQLLQGLLAEIFKNDTVEIGVSYSGRKICATLTYDHLNSDT